MSELEATQRLNSGKDSKLPNELIDSPLIFSLFPFNTIQVQPPGYWIMFKVRLIDGSVKNLHRKSTTNEGAHKKSVLLEALSFFTEP